MLGSQRDRRRPDRDRLGAAQTGDADELAERSGSIDPRLERSGRLDDRGERCIGVASTGQGESREPGGGDPCGGIDLVRVRLPEGVSHAHVLDAAAVGAQQHVVLLQARARGAMADCSAGLEAETTEPACEHPPAEVHLLAAEAPLLAGAEPHVEAAELVDQLSPDRPVAAPRPVLGTGAVVRRVSAVEDAEVGRGHDRREARRATVGPEPVDRAARDHDAGIAEREPQVLEPAGTGARIVVEEAQHVAARLDRARRCGRARAPPPARARCARGLRAAQQDPR